MDADDNKIRLEDLRVMIVDDNKHMRTLIKGLFYALGCKNISESADGSEALEELRSRPIDLIITDWAMQPLDGLEFLKLLRQSSDSKNPKVPVIMLTGHTEVDRIFEARDAGITEILAKPISAEKLYTKVISVLKRPRKFIKSKKFVGPDRRRRRVEHDGKEKRKVTS